MGLTTAFLTMTSKRQQKPGSEAHSIIPDMYKIFFFLIFYKLYRFYLIVAHHFQVIDTG